jgi:tetratricopeptide (TPR) repeat protein
VPFDLQIFLGVAYMFRDDKAKGDLAKATELFQRAYLQAPNSFAASNYLALAKANSDDPEDQKRAFDFAENNVTKYRNEPEAYATLGWTLYRVKRLDDAERAFATAASMGQLRSDTAYYWARLNADRGRTDEAIRLLRSALATSAPFLMREEAESLLEKLAPNSPG